jgi:hypothetical protein
MWKPSYGSAVTGVVQLAAAADEGATEAVAVDDGVDPQPCANSTMIGSAKAHRVCDRLDTDEA